jgi:hypothetical protein
MEIKTNYYLVNTANADERFCGKLREYVFDYFKVNEKSSQSDIEGAEAILNELHSRIDAIATKAFNLGIDHANRDWRVGYEQRRGKGKV